MKEGQALNSSFRGGKELDDALSLTNHTTAAARQSSRRAISPSHRRTPIGRSLPLVVLRLHQIPGPLQGSPELSFECSTKNTLFSSLPPPPKHLCKERSLSLKTREVPTTPKPSCDRNRSPFAPSPQPPPPVPKPA